MRLIPGPPGSEVYGIELTYDEVNDLLDIHGSLSSTGDEASYSFFNTLLDGLGHDRRRPRRLTVTSRGVVRNGRVLPYPPVVEVCVP